MWARIRLLDLSVFEVLLGVEVLQLVLEKAQPGVNSVGRQVKVAGNLYAQKPVSNVVVTQ